MRRILKSAAVITVVTLLLTGCEGWFDIGEPEIITPTMTAGSEVDGNQVKFMWHSVENATGYAIEIAEDNEFGSLLYSDSTIIDTFHYVSTDSFEWDTTYYWRVKASDEDGWGKWSDIACFDLAFPGLDLDTTYFPFGLGYEWCYERHNWGWREPEYPEDTNTSWSNYDTFLVSVTDSFWNADTLCFQLQGGFRDIVNPVKIWEDCIEVGLGNYWSYLVDTISVIKPDTYYVDNWYDWYGIRLSEDTLSIFAGYDIREYSADAGSERTTRIKEIGIIGQSEYCAYEQQYWENTNDRLLYFYNGVDTVYKAPD